MSGVVIYIYGLLQLVSEHDYDLVDMWLMWNRVYLRMVCTRYGFRTNPSSFQDRDVERENVEK
jgi:hypothetical protein